MELTNGELLTAAEEAGFAALVTADRNIRHQQNLSRRHVALVVLSTNAWQVLRNNGGLIADAVNRVQPGSYEEVGFRAPGLPEP